VGDRILLGTTEIVITGLTDGTSTPPVVPPDGGLRRGRITGIPTARDFRGFVGLYSAPQVG
jgi:hypothetical protein